MRLVSCLHRKARPEISTRSFCKQSDTIEINIIYIFDNNTDEARGPRDQGHPQRLNTSYEKIKGDYGKKKTLILEEVGVFGLLEHNDSKDC